MNSLKVVSLCAALLCGALVLGAQTPQWQWAVQAGGTGDEYGHDIAMDSQGNQYVTGRFLGTATFGSYTLTSSGTYDIFAAKLDPAGNFLWAVSAGGANSDMGLGIDVDGAGNSWLIGIFQETATFGTYTLTSSGLHDIFAAKLDPAGNFLWAVRAGGENYDRGYGIAVSSDGNAYLTGYFTLTSTFGPYTLTATGFIDIFAVKLDSAGNFLWAVKAGGASYDFGNGIAVDSAGNACLTGYFGETASFGSYSITSGGTNDIFAAKLDSAGNWLWAVRAGGTSLDEGQSITFDSAGNTWLTGEIGGAAASFGDTILTSNGSFDIFICKLDSAGNWLWAVNVGGTSADYAFGIAVDGAGNAWLTGMFKETAAFGPYTLTSSGGWDIFAAKLDPAGNFLWAVNAGGTSGDQGYGVAVDGSGNACLTGYFESTATFGPFTLTSSGEEDVFIAKLSPGTAVEDELNPPAIPLVLSASPNPFAASTLIAVAGDKLEGLQGNASLDIFDLRGRKVRSLAIASIPHDGFCLTWDGRDERGIPCPSGCYLARLETPNRRATLKLALIK